MTTATAPTVGSYLQVDPKTLAIGTNARETVHLDDEFVASIKARGVLEPIHVYTADDGQLTVDRGQRRTLAGIKAKRKTVPVIVVAPPADRDRIIDQVTENVHRASMTTVDVAAAVEQLALLGVTEAQIEKSTALPKKSISAALAARKSEAAMAAAAASPALDLHHLEGIAEFDGDEEAVRDLTMAAEEGEYDHRLQQLRDDREEKAAKGAYADQLREQGLTVIDEPRWYAEQGPIRLDNLVEHPSDDKHASCPGHAVYVTKHYVWLDEAGTVHEDVTWQQRDELKLHQERRWHGRGVCLDPEANGHTRRTYSSGGGDTRPKGPMSDEEKEARRLLIDRNKQWNSASKVRRDWLSQFADRKEAPKDAQVFIYRELLQLPYQLKQAMETYGKAGGHRAFRDIVGLDVDGLTTQQAIEGELAELLDRIADMTPKRATLLTAVLVLCSWHAWADAHVWQSPSATDRRMLRQMRDWGYPLSAVERLVTDAPEVAEPAAEGDDAAADDDGVVEFETTGDEEADAAAEEAALARNLAGEPTTITSDSVIVAVVDHHDLTADTDPIDEIA